MCRKQIKPKQKESLEVKYIFNNPLEEIYLFIVSRFLFFHSNLFLEDTVHGVTDHTSPFSFGISRLEVNVRSNCGHYSILQNDKRILVISSASFYNFLIHLMTSMSNIHFLLSILIYGLL